MTLEFFTHDFHTRERKMRVALHEDLTAMHADGDLNSLAMSSGEVRNASKESP